MRHFQTPEGPAPAGASDRWLFSREALEVSHLRGHLLASGVGGGADTLNAQLELVRIRGPHQGLVERDEFLRVQVEERLIEGLHPVLRGAGADRVVDQTGLVRVDDAVLDVRRGNHDFDGRDAALVIGAAYEAL